MLGTASVLVLQFESHSAEANITTGWDAFWYSMVTITTVGYGDYYPVTAGGRVAAMFIMIAGVGIIGALASILASVLVGGGSGDDDTPAPDEEPTARDAELADMKAELVSIRSMLERIESRVGPSP